MLLSAVAFCAILNALDAFECDGDAGSPTSIEAGPTPLTELHKLPAFYDPARSTKVMAPADFRVEVRPLTAIVWVSGDIDVDTIDDFRAALDEAEAFGGSAIIVSLTSARYVCARTFGVLIVRGHRLRLSRRVVFVVCPPRHIGQRIMSVIRYPYRWFDTIDDALSASRASSQARSRRPSAIRPTSRRLRDADGQSPAARA